MPLVAALDGTTQDEASWQPDPATPSIEQIVRHIAWSKSSFCHRGFGTAMPLVDPDVNGDGDSPGLPQEFPCGAGWGVRAKPGIGGAIGLLEEAQLIFRGCLQCLAEDVLDEPIPTHNGKSAANFFWVMLMHDVYHAGQIRTRRTLFAAKRRIDGQTH
jgi:hypothetical protein